MALTQELLQRFMTYCRIDEPEPGDEILLETIYEAAVAYMKQAGVSEPTEGSPRKAQFDLCVNYLVLDGYDNRNVIITGTIVADNPVFRRLLNQLKLSEPAVSDSDTTGWVV